MAQEEEMCVWFRKLEWCLSVNMCVSLRCMSVWVVQAIIFAWCDKQMCVNLCDFPVMATFSAPFFAWCSEQKSETKLRFPPGENNTHIFGVSRVWMQCVLPRGAERFILVARLHSMNPLTLLLLTLSMVGISYTSIMTWFHMCMTRVISWAAPLVVFVWQVMVTELTVELMTRHPELSVIQSMVCITKSAKQIIIGHLTCLIWPIKPIASVAIRLNITQTCIECHSRKTTVMFITQIVTDLQATGSLVLKTETRVTMKGTLIWHTTGMTVKKEVYDFQGTMSTTMIIQVMIELKKRFAVLWGTCMILRGITPRFVDIVAVQEMLRIIMLIGIWLRYHAGNVRNPIMEAVTGATNMEIMFMGTNAVEVQPRIVVKLTMEPMPVTVMRWHIISISQLNWKSGFRNVVVTQEVRLTIHQLQLQDQEPYL